MEPTCSSLLLSGPPHTHTYDERDDGRGLGRSSAVQPAAPVRGYSKGQEVTSKFSITTLQTVIT